MLPLQRHLISREIGQPAAQKKIEQALDRKIAENIAKDRFSSITISLSNSCYHRTFRYRDFVAVLSMNKAVIKERRLALWSLVTKCKLWEVKINANYHEFNPGTCLLNKDGLILVDSDSADVKTIVFDGKITGFLPKLNWRSLVPIKNRIIGCWLERKCSDDGEPCWLPENSNAFFGVWNKHGDLQYRHLLDRTRSRWSHQYVSSKNFWVRLSGIEKTHLKPLIEVVDLASKTMKAFELPMIADEVKFSTAFITQNLLFYGIWMYNRSEKKIENYIGFFDLMKGEVLDEIPIPAKWGESLRYLTANQQYVVWLGYRGSKYDCVKYLDLSNKIVKKAADAPYSVVDSKVCLDIAGSMLSVTCAQGDWNYGNARWNRKLVDLASGELKSEITYKRYPWGECSIANGNMLITDKASKQARMYVESFTGESLTEDEATFRI